MTCDKEVLEATIEEIARRADALHLAYSRDNITWVDDSGFTFVMLKNYFDLNDFTIPKNALELYYIAPKAFKNPSNCADIMLRATLERGYNEDEIIPYLHVVVRVIVRDRRLFAIISNNNKVMFGDDTDTDIFQQYMLLREEK